MRTAPVMASRDTHADYICRRVVDALLREDVRECVSRAQVLTGEVVPFASRLPSALRDGQWLMVTHLGEGRLWLPVQRCRFMQDWRLRALVLIWEHGRGLEHLQHLPAILARFQHGLQPEAARRFDDFAAECLTAAEHREICEDARRRYARTWQGEAGAVHALDRLDWSTRMLHYDRWAAFQDHPFYPTARAKLGFAAADLAHYAPEFQPVFQLCWLAVPQALYVGDIVPAKWWPDFADVGLDPALRKSHALLPVHPFMWARLDGYLAESGLRDRIMPAPRDHLEVSPTLSVRTVVPAVAPHWHLKLPLPIRTLGARNIRTIKPSTIRDGQVMQEILAGIAAREPDIGDRLLLTDEGLGAHVAHQAFLGFILRRYPDGLEDSHLVPVAALPAAAPDGRLVMASLAARFFAGRVLDFFDTYLDLTLRLHLLLWIRYGIALESNQQNSVLVLSDREPRLRLLLKDNDAGRICASMFAARCPDWAPRLGRLQDRRIVVDSALPLAQMFSTITLQLNVAALVESLAEAGHGTREALYARVRDKLENVLAALEGKGEDTALARRVLLEDEHLYIKYLLRAASLESKEITGAADVNKFYGKSAPNFLRWS